jgi:hypothetical protein
MNVDLGLSADGPPTDDAVGCDLLRVVPLNHARSSQSARRSISRSMRYLLLRTTHAVRCDFASLSRSYPALVNLNERNPNRGPKPGSQGAHGDFSKRERGEEEHYQRQRVSFNCSPCALARRH